MSQAGSLQCLCPWQDGTTLSHVPLPMGVLELLQCPWPAQPSLGHAAGANTPLWDSRTGHKHRPPPTSQCFPLFPLILLSFQMHFWEACKVAAASWSRTLQSAPFSTLCCPVLCINRLSGNAGLQTLPVLSDLAFCPLK